MLRDDHGISAKAQIELLTDMNWDTWCFLMEQYLTVNDLWDIVSGHETEPSSDTEKAAFLRKQRSAHAHIALHVSPAQLTTIRLESDPKKIWEELQRLNRPHGFGTHVVLHCKLANMKWGPHLSMSTWIMSVRDIARQIRDLKGNVAEEDIIVILTNSLLEMYAPLVVHLDVMEEKERTLSHVITHLVGEECCQNRDKDQGCDKTACGPSFIPFIESLIPFHLSYIPFLGGIFLPIFTTFFETAIALEVASGDSFVAGTEPDNLPIMWQVWEHEPDMEPDKSFLYFIMWELAVV